MPISTLDKFTVPVQGGGGGMLMPKLPFRFRALFQNFGKGDVNNLSVLTRQVLTIKRPTVTFENIDVHTYNSKVVMAGKHSWGDVTCTLRDDSTGIVTKQIGEQLQKQFDFFEMSSAASAVDYKFVLAYEMLDGGNGNGSRAPVVLERWELYGCYLQSVDYQEIGYDKANSVVQINMTIKYDNAQQITAFGGGGVGDANILGRTLGTLATGAAP